MLRKKCVEMNAASLKKTLTGLVLCLCLLLVLTAPSSVLAADTPAPPLKIAVYNNSDFAYQDAQGVWRGTDIECMINVAQRAGFTPVFIDSANDADFMGNLDRGVYDIVADVIKSPERLQKYLFSEETLGRTPSTMAVRYDDDRWEYGNIEQVSRMRVGLIATYTINNLFRQWCKERKVTPVIVEYPNIEALSEALQNRAIDAEIYTVIYEKEGKTKSRTIMKFLPQEYYFAFRKNDYKLKNSFDAALAQIVLDNPYYLTELQKKYAGQFQPGNFLFSKLEKQYLADHPVVSVAMITNNAPYYEVTSDGKTKGILPEYLTLLAAKLGLEFRFDNYPTYEAAVMAVQEGKSDLMGFYTGGLISANQYGLSLTDNYISSGNMLLTKANAVEGPNRSVGIRHLPLDPAKRELGSDLSSLPLKQYATSLSCFQALENGAVEAVVLDLPTATWLLNQLNSANYVLKPLPGMNLEVCGATKASNRELCSILNKGIAVSKSDLNGIIANATQSENTWRTFIARLSPTVIVLVTSILLFLIAGLLWTLFLLRNRQKERTVVLAAQAENEKQKLQVAAIKKNAVERNKFFANISHDMRTPLNAILGFSLLAQKPEVSIGEKDLYLSKIHGAGSLMLDLVNDTLTLSKINSGKLETKLEPLQSDLEQFFKPVLETVRSLASAKNIEFTFENASTAKRPVLIDRLNQQKVLLNLLTNAVKYTPAGGHVKARFWNEKAADGLWDSLFSVEDDGIGISPEFMAHVFEPFRQEKRPGYENSGTGLGLAIVKQIVELMGGTITVKSELNHGTTFTIRLRLKAARDQAAEPKPEPALRQLANQDGVKVLLCEDNHLNREIACALLRAKKLEVVTAANGQIGVDLFNTNPPGTFAVILMDLRMPVMDGYEAVKQIRQLERPDAQSIPIIAMSADAFADDIQRCLDGGMNDHIAKPIDPNILYATLAKYLPAG